MIRKDGLTSEQEAEREMRRRELVRAFARFHATLRGGTTLNQRAEKWRDVDIARLRHEFTIPDSET